MNKYHDAIFDCDGVILDSNSLKTSAFKEVTKKFGAEIVDAFVSYHKQNGGVSRYKKFEWLFKNLIKECPSQKQLLNITKQYASIVAKKMLSCKITPGLKALKEHANVPNWSIVSGGDQTELREIFRKRDLNKFFNSGIYGSPKPKRIIFQENFQNGIFKLPAVYFGDSKMDYEVAKEFDVDFVFISDWTEFLDWKPYILKNKIFHTPKLRDLLLFEK